MVQPCHMLVGVVYWNKNSDFFGLGAESKTKQEFPLNHWIYNKWTNDDGGCVTYGLIWKYTFQFLYKIGQNIKQTVFNFTNGILHIIIMPDQARVCQCIT